MPTFRYPCTGRVSHAGFAAYLERELGEPRKNLLAFAAELGGVFGAEHVTLVNSGSSANLAAALALAEAATPGARAVTAGFTFPTTAAALLHAGFAVDVADVTPDGFAIDPDAVRRALRPETRLLCVTHFLGFPADLEPLFALADEHRLLVLQDACEGMDLRAGGRPVHQWGGLTTWSFYHPHHLPAYGGGAVVCPDADWRRRVESLTHWGRECTCHYDPAACPAPPGMDHYFHYVRAGCNLEMSELNACFGRWQLRRWDEIERRRRCHYEILFEALWGLPEIRVRPPPDGGSPFVFPITLRQGEVGKLACRLASRGVEVRSLMGGAVVDQPAFRHLSCDGLPHCRAVAAASFFVGVHQTLPEEDVAAVAAILAEEVRQ